MRSVEVASVHVPSMSYEKKSVADTIQESITLKTGRIREPARELKVVRKGHQFAVSPKYKLDRTVRKALNRSLMHRYGHMLVQGSDYPEISLKVFAAKDCGKVVGYGVWGGGDVGLAQLEGFTMYGKSVGLWDQKSHIC